MPMGIQYFIIVTAIIDIFTITLYTATGDFPKFIRKTYRNIRNKIKNPVGRMVIYGYNNEVGVITNMHLNEKDKLCCSILVGEEIKVECMKNIEFYDDAKHKDKSV